MSHDATNWAIKQRGLKPAAKIVLWHLADCHNGHTGQCNPRQATLAVMCEMSRSTLNLHLSKLEERGLIKRVTSIDETTKRQRPTHYILAMDGPLKAVSGNGTQTPHVGSGSQGVVVPCPKSGLGAVSEKQQKPCPNNDHSRVLNSDTKNLGKEPGRQPAMREALDAAVADPVDDQPTRRDQVLALMGVDRCGLTSAGKFTGSVADVAETEKWSAMGLTVAEQDGVIREMLAKAKSKNPEFLPSTWRWFTTGMSSLVSAKSAPAPTGSASGFSAQTDREKHLAYLRRLAGNPAAQSDTGRVGA